MVTLVMFMSIVWLPKFMRLDQAWQAVVEVESHGNANAVGDNGAAIGVAQIHRVLVDDVNRILRQQKYTYEDRRDVVKSREMFVIYCLHYYPNGDIEQWSRAWNGGPKGPSKLATKGYWEKVQKHLKSSSKKR